VFRGGGGCGGGGGCAVGGGVLGVPVPPMKVCGVLFFVFWPTQRPQCPLSGGPRNRRGGTPGMGFVAGLGWHGRRALVV